MIIESYRSNKNILELSRIFGIPRRTVGSVIKKFHEFDSVENRSGRGRKRLFSDRDTTQLSRVVKQNRRRPLQDITTIISLLVPFLERDQLSTNILIYTK